MRKLLIAVLAAPLLAISAPIPVAHADACDLSAAVAREAANQ